MICPKCSGDCRIIDSSKRPYVFHCCSCGLDFSDLKCITEKEILDMMDEYIE